MGWAAIFTYEAVRQVALLGGADVAERASGGAAALLQRRLSDAADEQRDAAAAAERRDEMRHAEEGITGLQVRRRAKFCFTGIDEFKILFPDSRMYFFLEESCQAIFSLHFTHFSLSAQRMSLH